MAGNRRKKRNAVPLVNNPLAQQQPLVSGRWLAASLVCIFGGGLALVYLTSCLLFWQGQWQILFHPSHTITHTPATLGLAFDELHFATTETGQPRLDGWFLPVEDTAPYASSTVLYLHSMESGSLSDALPELAALHQLGVNVFAFDYRGFGKSEPAHPTEKLATEDVDAAWQYLIETRHLLGSSIVFDGKGLGASLAAEAAARHPEAAAVILDSPSPTALELLRKDPRSHWMPVRLLAHDRFDPGQTLVTLKQPKLLFLSANPNAAGLRYAKEAADPKTIVYGARSSAALARFLDDLPRN